MTQKKEQKKGEDKIISLGDYFECKNKKFKIVYLRIDKNGRSILEAVEQK